MGEKGEAIAGPEDAAGKDVVLGTDGNTADQVGVTATSGVCVKAGKAGMTGRVFSIAGKGAAAASKAGIS